MKTVDYSVSIIDRATVLQVQNTYMAKCEEAYKEAPHCFGNRSIESLRELWKSNGGYEGMFTVIERDGLAYIAKEEDAYYTFADHAGDCFDPTVNTDIDPEELKRQERRERARMSRQGAWYHTLHVDGVEGDCIGGFVGNDFYGSGYDTDFYAEAVNQLKSKYPTYIAELMEAGGMDD